MRKTSGRYDTVEGNVLEADDMPELLKEYHVHDTTKRKLIEGVMEITDQIK